MRMIPCVIFEDEHLLAVNKPAGWNTHAPAPHAGEGIYDWLRHREPRWASLAILHRLDKETSGVLLFGKTPLANRSLTEQFAGRSIRKKYRLLTDRAPKQKDFTARSNITRAGDHYVSGAVGETAETTFRSVAADPAGRERLELSKCNSPQAARGQFEPLPLRGIGCYEIEAEPHTGRTHQIRVHAAEHGFPILGDTLYGGAAFSRVCLHAAELTFQHPAMGEAMTLRAPVDFTADGRLALRYALIEPDQTNACRLIHGSSDGWPGWYVERLGDYLLSQSDQPLTQAQAEKVEGFLQATPAPLARGAYHKILSRHVRRSTITETSPQLIAGEAAPERFSIRENGVQFEMSFTEGYSVGLFLDQRDNRRRLLTHHIAATFPLLSPTPNSQLPTPISQTPDPRPQVLNTFAYTCGFSVCAALGGARVTSLDLSKKYLEWGRRNFALNGLDPARHDFIYGDTFDWLKRLAKKQRVFDAVLLDPPTFSQSKEGGVFRADKDYGRLVTAALGVLKPGGILFASTNAAEWPPEEFLAAISQAIRGAGRKIGQQHYVPQPPDFPETRAEPAYLKTAWIRVA